LKVFSIKARPVFASPNVEFSGVKHCVNVWNGFPSFVIVTWYSPGVMEMAACRAVENSNVSRQRTAKNLNC
jgi:hypothetical protein